MSKDFDGTAPKSDNVQESIEKKKSYAASILGWYFALLEDIELVSKIFQHLENIGKIVLFLCCRLTHVEPRRKVNMI